MVFTKHNSIKSDIFFNLIFIPYFSGSRFFRVWLQGLGPGFRSSHRHWHQHLHRHCKNFSLQFFFWESRTFMSNTPKYSSLCLVISANLLFLRSESWRSLYTVYRNCLGLNPFICFWNRMLKKDFNYVWEWSGYKTDILYSILKKNFRKIKN